MSKNSEKPKKINSQQKGARGERNWAKFLREYGYEAERGQQHAGGKDSPDVKTNMPGIHWEVKCVERLNLALAIKQSERDAGENEIPAVAHKKNYTGWYVTVPAEDFMKLYQAWERSKQ